MRTTLLTFIFTGFLALAPLVMGQVTTNSFQDGDINAYAGTQDTELRFSAPTNILGGNVSISVDGLNAGGEEHGLMRFDGIVGAGPNQIPPGNAIGNASLTFWSSDIGGVVSVHRMLVDWDEATATWSNRVNGIQTNDLEAANTPTVTFVGPDDAYVTIDVTADVQAWADGTTNQGWAFLPTEDNGWDFDSSESLTQTNRPILTVQHGTPTAPFDASGGTLPMDVTVLQGQRLELTASFGGLPAPSIQWFVDGFALPGSVSNTYVVTSMTAGDVGNYFARATNPLGTVDSRTATVGYLADNTGPSLLTTPPNNPRILDNLSVILTFDEPLESTSFDSFSVEIYPVGGDPVQDNLGVANATLVNETNFVLTTTLPAQLGVDYRLNLFAGAVSDVLFNPSPDDVLDEPMSNLISGPSLVSGTVATDGSIVLVFDEPMSNGVPAQISIYPTGDDPVLDNLGVQSVTVDANPTNLVLTTTNAPILGVGYTVRILAGGVHDANGTPSESEFTLPLSQQLTIFRTGSVWRYLDDGSDQGTAWKETTFNDSAWASGPAQLGYGDGDEATVVSFGPQSTNKYVTTYFRTTFEVLDASDFTGLIVNLQRDDSAAVYLNGTEVARDNLPAPPAAILFDTFATATTANADETTFFQTVADPALLVTGTNTLAVEVHQANLTSSDISMDLFLTGEATTVTGEVPSFTLQPGPSPQTTNENGSAAFSVATDGFPFPTLQWEFDNGVDGFLPLPGATDSELVINPVLPSNSGDYRVVASNFLGTAVSDSGSLTVIPDTLAPVLLDARGDDKEVVLNFSKVLASSASDAGNYALDLVAGGGALTITNVIVNGSQVTLQHAEPQPNGNYEVTVSGLTDTAETPNLIDPNPTVLSYSSDLTLIPVDAVWRALDDGSDQGTAWRNPGFNDGSWTNGPAELGYGDGDEATILGFGTNATEKFATTYFRHTFTLANDGGFTNLSVSLHYDDGAVTYVNGTEVNRVNITNDFAHPVRFDQFAGPIATDNRFEIFTIDPNLLVAGENTVAVEIHQTAPTSSDISFSLALTGATGEIITVPDIILGTPLITGGDVMIEFSGSGTLYVQETDELAVNPAATIWTTITTPPGPHTSPLNVGPTTGVKRYFRVTDTP